MAPIHVQTAQRPGQTLVLSGIQGTEGGDTPEGRNSSLPLGSPDLSMPEGNLTRQDNLMPHSGTIPVPKLSRTPKAHKREKAAPGLQVLVQDTGKYKEEGTGWLISRTVNCLYVSFIDCYNILHRFPALIVQHVFEMALLVVAFAICIYLAITAVDGFSSASFAFLITHMALSVPVIINLVCQLSLAFARIQVTEKVWITYLMAMLFYYLSGFMVFLLFFGSQLPLALVLVFLMFCSCLVFNSLIIFVLLLLPFLGCAVVLEFLVRLAFCSLSCPKVEKLIVTYEYQTYYFDSAFYDASSCVICLAKLSNQDVVCVLQCHPSHVFHANCVLEWVKKQSHCPVCRKAIVFDNI